MLSPLKVVHVCFHPRQHLQERRARRFQELEDLKKEPGVLINPHRLDKDEQEKAREEILALLYPPQSRSRKIFNKAKKLTLWLSQGVVGTIVTVFGIYFLTGLGYRPEKDKPPVVQGLEKKVNMYEAFQNEEKDRLLLIENSKEVDELSDQIKLLIKYSKPRVVHISHKIGDDGYTQGSGFILRSDGIIVTNEHVVKSDDNKIAEKVEVTLHNGKKVTGKVLGADSKTDLAAIKINVNDLPTLELTNEAPEEGELVMAMGHPTGILGWSASLGIITGSKREFEVYKKEKKEKIEDLIQTDAPINPGNSGGPLLNMKGEVVALNESKMSIFFESLGFSVPASTIKKVIPELIAKSKKPNSKPKALPGEIISYLTG